VLRAFTFCNTMPTCSTVGDQLRPARSHARLVQSCSVGSAGCAVCFLPLHKSPAIDTAVVLDVDALHACDVAFATAISVLVSPSRMLGSCGHLVRRDLRAGVLTAFTTGLHRALARPAETGACVGSFKLVAHCLPQAVP